MMTATADVWCYTPSPSHHVVPSFSSRTPTLSLRLHPQPPPCSYSLSIAASPNSMQCLTFPLHKRCLSSNHVKQYLKRKTERRPGWKWLAHKWIKIWQVYLASSEPHNVVGHGSRLSPVRLARCLARPSLNHWRRLLLLVCLPSAAVTLCRGRLPLCPQSPHVSGVAQVDSKQWLLRSPTEPTASTTLGLLIPFQSFIPLLWLPCHWRCCLHASHAV